MNEASRALEDAHAAVVAADEQLNAELAQIGPGLTPEQQTEYVKAYREKYADVYAAEATAAAELKAALESPALANSPETLTEGYAALANSSEAEAALAWASESFATPGSPFHQSEAVADIAGTAAANAAASILASAESPQAAMEQLQGYLEPFIDAGKTVPKFAGLKTAWEAASAAANGNYDRLANLAQQWDGKNPLFKAIAVIGVAAGAASATNAAAQGRYTEAIRGFAMSGRQGLELLAGATRSLAQSGKLAMLGRNAAMAERLAGLAGRLAPALGMVAGAAALASHHSEYAQSGNKALLVSMAGDMLSIAGSALELTPLAPVGGIINAAGLAISAVGDFLKHITERGMIADEKRELMMQAGMPEDVARALASPNANASELQELGLSPEQVQEVARAYPDLLSIGGYFTAITDAARGVGVPPEDFKAFVDTLVGQFGNEFEAGSILNTIREQEMLRTDRPPDVERALREYLAAVVPEAAALAG